MGDDRVFFRHTLATLAYRGSKAVRGAPTSFADFKASPTSRTPVEILAHIGDLLDWLLTQARGEEKWNNATPLPWDKEIARFHAALAALDAHLASDQPIVKPIERMFQGGIADALTHVGQITMLRRIAGAPMKGENYSRATITAGQLGPDQVPADPRFEFD